MELFRALVDALSHNGKDQFLVAHRNNYAIIQRMRPRKILELSTNLHNTSILGLEMIELRVVSEDGDSYLLRDGVLSEKDITLNGFCFSWKNLPSFQEVLDLMVSE